MIPVLPAWRAGFALLLLLPAAAACIASPLRLRVEDRPADNRVRIVNPTSRPVHFYFSDEGGFRKDFQLFHLRYRDGQGQPVRFAYERVDNWWTPLIHSSSIHPVGRAPAQRLTLAAGESRDYPRDALFQWFETWRREHPAVTGPCMVQLRISGRVNPRARERIEIRSEWQPAPCPASRPAGMP